MRPNAKGLVVSPSIPSEWDGFTISKNFRGHHLDIEVDNSAHVESGVRELWLNGEKLEGCLIPADKMVDKNTVKVVLG